ncbi:MAG: iron-containing alcohol dehydrogenase [Alphaproteobacteria bacterium]
MTAEANTLEGTWSFPTTIWFGAGKIATLPDACRELGIDRPMLVTDPGLAALPMIAEAIGRNEAAGLPTILFQDVRPNPVHANVEVGIAAFRQHDRDGIIAVGGGSALDVGKVIALMVGQTMSIWDFVDGRDDWRRANHEAIVPVIAVPTTAGTGSETGRSGVITDEAAKTKRIIFHPRIMPSIVISDPELTVGLPPHITAATGMDALAHCLEAYCSPVPNPFCDGVALEGMRLIHTNLRRAVEHGDDLAARARMLAAASMGSTAFQKGLGAIHALSHPVGALYDTHHGLTNAVVMPYVLAFNRPAIEDALARVAAYLGLDEPGFDGFMAWILDLRERIGIPHTLAELGVEEARLDVLAAMAAADTLADTNPVRIGVAECRRLYEESMSGSWPS